MFKEKNPGEIGLQHFGLGVLETEESVLTIDDVKAFIEANKDREDVSEYLKTFVVEKELNTETVNAYLETAEGKVLLQPRLDRYATQAIKTHDEKQAPVLDAKIKAGINEGIRKLHPEETDEQRQVRELRDDMEKMRREGEAKELKNAILMEANNRRIPNELVEGIPYPSVDHFKNIASVLEKTMDDIKTKAINEFIATNSPKPGSGQSKNNDGRMTFSQFAKLPQAERNRMAETGEIDNLVPD